MKRDSIPDSSDISTKHLPLRIVLFVLAVIVAVSAITYGVKRAGGSGEIRLFADGRSEMT